ncbi:hypothetical protein Mgra_00007932, partial [Meloidogyne graminicola]
EGLQAILVEKKTTSVRGRRLFKSCYFYLASDGIIFAF